MKVELVDIEEIEEVIIAYANGEFDRRLTISDSKGDRDTVVTGINMLGEELQYTTISRDYFSSIYNAVSEILIVIDLEGKITDINTATKTFFNKSKKEMLNIDISSLISERYANIVNAIIKNLSPNQTNYSFESAMIPGNDIEIPVLCTLSKIVDRQDKHKGYLLIAKNITDQKNKEINDLKIIIATQERERNRLANDLHDSLGQELNAIKMYINSLAVMDPLSNTYKESIETTKNIVDGALENIRNISFNLMPKSLEHGGLLNALSELVTRLKAICDIDYNFPTTIIHLDKESEIILFRIIQEFLNNSLKHAKDSKINLKITCDKNLFNLIIEDFGTGYNSKTVKYGNGVTNMKTRMEALNAHYDYGSILNKGTYLYLTLTASNEDN